MSNYSVFFDYNGNTYKLPVNPEQIEVKSSLATEKYNVLELGQIVEPTNAELKGYSFECEFPYNYIHYAQNRNGFKNSDYYLNLFEKWRKEKVHIRFIVKNGIGENIDTLALITELNITEKAGEEGDKYVSFNLIEYKEYGKKSKVIQTSSTTATIEKTKSVADVNPKANKTYTVVKGDSLWRIAKIYYGNGLQYPKIYNANKDKIKNPSLIYPGQVFTIPS
ncbi:LysM peptidoglycan-binding domain-containing protein [Anaerovorax odorimutans]|uniref:LysM peptidoglycan-binding domain-containing protein n=1 Tax=Anaerovorax odorimutans TaxID=109327 RepID=UPI000407B7F0|nr:LysM peptidoglycan-binding domain-containing protein [Anaerovorax odorimutans]